MFISSVYAEFSEIRSALMIFHFVADMIVNFSYKFKLSTQQWFYFHLIRRGFLCTALVKMRTRFSLIFIIIRCNQSSQRYLCFNVEQKKMNMKYYEKHAEHDVFWIWFSPIPLTVLSPTHWLSYNNQMPE